MRKKIFALLLLLVMALSLFPVPAIAEEIDTWEELQQAIDRSVEGTTITLTQDLKASDSDDALVIHQNKKVILNLNGYTLDRGLTNKDAKEKGYVFEVASTSSLAIMDSSSGKTGKITGGNTEGDGGGIYLFSGSTFVMTGGTITGNKATGSGGGIYVATITQLEEPTCLAAGTPITRADGTRTAIENLKKGDEVRVFDHENGEVSSAKLFDLWKYPEKKTGAFTLHFSHGIDVTAVGGHCFFDKAENQYVAIDTKNVNDYIGHQFYNVDDACWETLMGVTFLTEAVDTYIIVSEKHLNVAAGGMLSNEDGIYTLLGNIFAFGENLTVDAAAKAADIARYGLWDYENMQYFSRYAYDALDLQYMSMIFGRGMFTPEEFAELEAYSAEIDPELYCGTAKETADLQKEIKTEKSSLMNFLTEVTAPLVTIARAVDSMEWPTTPGIHLGGTAKITGNTAGGKENNVYLCDGKLITVFSPVTDMSVGVTLEGEKGQFSANGASYAAYFFADDTGLTIFPDGNGLKLDTKTTGGHHYYGPDTPSVNSATTGDMGVILCGALSIGSLIGLGWVGKKKHQAE